MFLFDLLMKYRRRFNDQCTQCGDSLQVQTLNTVVGRDQRISVRFENLKVRSCGKENHPKRYFYPDFGYELTEEIFYGAQSPTSRTNALLNLRSKTKCFSCGEILDNRFAASQELTIDLNLEKTPELQLSIKGPVTACRSCGVKQIVADEETSFQISEAIVDAFNGIHLD